MGAVQTLTTGTNRMNVENQNSWQVKALEEQIGLYKEQNRLLGQIIEDEKVNRQHLFQQLDLYREREKLALLREQRDYRQILALEDKVKQLSLPPTHEHRTESYSRSNETAAAEGNFFHNHDNDPESAPKSGAQSLAEAIAVNASIAAAEAKEKNAAQAAYRAEHRIFGSPSERTTEDNSSKTDSHVEASPAKSTMMSELRVTAAETSQEEEVDVEINYDDQEIGNIIDQAVEGSSNDYEIGSGEEANDNESFIADESETDAQAEPVEFTAQIDADSTPVSSFSTATDLGEIAQIKNTEEVTQPFDSAATVAAANADENHPAVEVKPLWVNLKVVTAAPQSEAPTTSTTTETTPQTSATVSNEDKAFQSEPPESINSNNEVPSEVSINKIAPNISEEKVDKKETNASKESVLNAHKSYLINEYFNKGLAASEQKNLSKAIELFTKVTHLLPDAAPSYFNLGILHYRLGQLDVALDFTKKAILLGSEPAKRLLQRIEAELENETEIALS